MPFSDSDGMSGHVAVEDGRAHRVPGCPYGDAGAGDFPAAAIVLESDHGDGGGLLDGALLDCCPGCRVGYPGARALLLGAQFRQFVGGRHTPRVDFSHLELVAACVEALGRSVREMDFHRPGNGPIIGIPPDEGGTGDVGWKDGPLRGIQHTSRGPRRGGPNQEEEQGCCRGSHGLRSSMILACTHAKL